MYVINIDSRKFAPMKFANEPVSLRRKVLGFLSYFTRIGYNSKHYEYYLSMDNWVEVGCSICDMVLGGLPREDWEEEFGDSDEREYCSDICRSHPTATKTWSEWLAKKEV